MTTKSINRTPRKFDDFLKERGTYEKTILTAELEILIELVEDSIQSNKMTKEVGKLILGQIAMIGQKMGTETNFTSSYSLSANN